MSEPAFDIHQLQNMDFIEEQWEKWKDETDFNKFECVSDDELKDAVVKDLSFVSNMSVQEYTLYQKWQEVQRKYPTEESILMGEKTLTDNRQHYLINDTKNKIWIPESRNDFEKLNPVLEFTDDSASNSVGKRNKELSERWATLRVFLSTMKNNSNIGRQLYFLVKDDTSGKYLGVICMSGDFMDLTARDSYIGWDRQEKTFGGKLNHTCIGSTIVPTQPLGYSYTGGKLLAYLCLSDVVQNLWKEKYGCHLVGVTTTSLYGKAKANTLSQYDGLKYWKRMGFSQGSVTYEPSAKTKSMIKGWLRKHNTRKYWEWYHALRKSGQPFKRDHKNRSYLHTFAKLGIDKKIISSEHNRGIYFARLYENTNDFLCGKIKEEQLTRRFDNSVEALGEMWKKKHASKRVKSLISRDAFSYDTHFYDDIVYLSWEETKQKYLKDVGR